MKKLFALLSALILSLTLLSGCGADERGGQSTAVNSTVSRMPMTVVSL